MREIKFRAWSESFGIKPYIPVIRNFTNKELDVNVWFSNMKDNNVVLMQYTGLKDKNGVEIYEGDIIHAEHYKPKNMKVEFIEGGFCMTNDRIPPIDINHFYPSLGCQFEVIGNIHQNPELCA